MRLPIGAPVKPTGSRVPSPGRAGVPAGPGSQAHGGPAWRPVLLAPRVVASGRNARPTTWTRGFTLLEMMIAAVLILLLLAIIYAMMSLGTGQFYRGGRKTDAMQTALLILEEMSSDLGRLAVSPQFAGRPVLIDRDAAAMSFCSLDWGASDERVIRGQTVTWSLRLGPIKGTFVPVRNGQPRKGQLINAWELVFFSKDDPATHGRDYVRVAIDATGLDGTGSHPTVQLIELRDSRLMAVLAQRFPVSPGLLALPPIPQPPRLEPEASLVLQKNRRKG